MRRALIVVAVASLAHARGLHGGRKGRERELRERTVVPEGRLEGSRSRRPDDLRWPG